MISKRIFVDSSAFYALMDRSDECHGSAKKIWPSLLEDHIILATSNYAVMETFNIIQYRLGFEAAQLWYKDILGVIDVLWVDQEVHSRGYELWLNLGRRRYSLVDCISYVLMHRNKIDTAFCFKQGYREQGFKVLVPLKYFHWKSSRSQPTTTI